MCVCVCVCMYNAQCQESKLPSVILTEYIDIYITVDCNWVENVAFLVNLLNQTKAQCQLHINVRHVSSRCVATRVPSLTKTKCLPKNRSPVISCRFK